MTDSKLIAGASSQPTLSALIKDATWHLYALEPATQTSLWLQLSEAQFRAASFLDQRLLASVEGSQPPVPYSLPLEELTGLTLRNAGPHVHFIFHIGHCGSTLLSRALAATTEVLPIREPLSLRQLAARLPATANEEWARMLDLALAAHSRVFHPGQVSMIKATSTCNNLILPLMERAPLSRSLLLFLPLESYLAGMLGKQSPALDLRGHAASRLDDWRRITGVSLQIAEITEFSEVQLAVISWLSSMARLLQASEQLGDRCLLLDFEVFLAEPETVLTKLISFFELTKSSSEILQAWPDIAVGYSKSPDEPYSAFNRSRTLARGRMQRAADIHAGMSWAEQLLDQFPQFELCRVYFGSL